MTGVTNMSSDDKILQLLTQIQSDISELKSDVAGLKQDVAGLKQDVAGLKQDVAGLKQDVAEIKKVQAVHTQYLKDIGQAIIALAERLDDFGDRVTELE